MYNTNLTSNVLFQKQDKGTKKKFQKHHIANEIVSYIKSKGWEVTPSRSSRRRPFADLLTTIAGIPVEICLGLQRLTPAHQNYRRSITAAGGIFLVVTSANEFYEWYHSFNPCRL